MGSKPSVAAPAHAPAQPADPAFSPHTARQRLHAQEEAGANISAASSGQSAELLKLFKHLAFKASTLNKHDTVVCVQEVLMQELGIAEPEYQDLKELLDGLGIGAGECHKINQEAMQQIVFAFPWAAARLADDGSPLALLLKNVPIHLALARALEQVLCAKKDEEKQYRTGQHETLVSRDMGTWHGQLEGDEFASACLDTLKNLQRDDVARALMLAHGNMVDSVWEHISRVRKSRKGIPTRADHSTKTFAAEEESANQTPAHNSSTQDLSPKMFSQFNFSADFNCLVPANDCTQTSVPYSEAKLGILRSVLGNVSCDDDSMLARIEAEHTTDLAATIVFTTPAGVTTTAAQEWIESIRYQSAETALIDAIGDEVDLAIPDSPCSVPSDERDRILFRIISSPAGAQLLRSEAMALLLLVGPMREVYNWRLAGAQMKKQHQGISPESESDDATATAETWSSTGSTYRQQQERVSTMRDGEGIGYEAQSTEQGDRKNVLAFTSPRAYHAERPDAFQPEHFLKGFEVTLHCACSALLKLSRLSSKRQANMKLFKGLNGTRAFPKIMRSSQDAVHEVGFLLASAHLVRIESEFQQDWRVPMAVWEERLQKHAASQLDETHQQGEALDPTWKAPARTDKITSCVAVIENESHAGVDLTWLCRICGRVNKDALDSEVVIFPPFCSLRTIGAAKMRLHTPFDDETTDLHGSRSFEWCSVPLEVQLHPGLTTHEQEGHVTSRRKAAHQTVVNEFLQELTSSAGWKDDWECHEFKQMSAALNFLPAYYNSDVAFSEAVKSSLEMRVAFGRKRVMVDYLYSQLARGTNDSVRPSRKQEAISLASISNGLDLPATMSLEERNRLQWLATFVATAPAGFFADDSYNEKLNHNFASVPWAQIQSSQSSPHGYLLPRGGDVDELRLAWSHVLRCGLKHVRVRPSRLPHDHELARDNTCEEIIWEVQTVQELLMGLAQDSVSDENTEKIADLRDLGLDLLKIAAPVVVCNVRVSKVLLEGGELNLDNLRQEQTLDWSQKYLDDEQCLVLAQALQHSCLYLHTLDLRGAVLGHEGDLALAHSLLHATTLTSLNGVSIVEKEVRWDLSGVRPLSSAMTAFLTCRVYCNADHILELDGLTAGRWMLRGLLRDKPYMMPYIARQIAADCEGIQSLDLCNNALAARDLRKLGISLVMCAFVTNLDLSGNELDASACCAFASAVVTHSSLHTKEHGSAPIGGQGVQKLERLCLANNAIDDDACVALSACIPLLRSLRDLDLRNNCIQDIGCTSLSRVLPCLNSCVSLFLAGNGLQRKSPGVRALLQEFGKIQTHGIADDCTP